MCQLKIYNYTYEALRLERSSLLATLAADTDVQIVAKLFLSMFYFQPVSSDCSSWILLTDFVILISVELTGV